MQKNIITISVVVIAFVGIIQLTWAIVSKSDATNTKIDSVISFLNQQLQKQSSNQTK